MLAFIYVSRVAWNESKYSKQITNRLNDSDCNEILQTQAANLKIDVMENIEQFIGSVLDLTEISFHITEADFRVQSKRCLKRCL